MTDTATTQTAQDETLEHLPPNCAFVLYGATGDLTHRKIVPALFDLSLQNLLPKNFVIVAFARRDKTDEVFREDLKKGIKEFAPKLPVDGEEWEKFAANIFYLRSNFDDLDGYKRLHDRLAQLDQERDLGGNCMFYLATPPDNFSQIIEMLGKSGLNRPLREGGWSRIIIEKPFGTDLASAKKLNSELGEVFHENQIFRIDHYLGKETVQNILVLRFANQIFEPLFNKNYIDNVQITVAESIGLEGRGGYFEHAGITRDIVQNHALQVLTLIAMEPPVTLTADAIRDEKVKVLNAIRPFSIEDVAQYTIRGQYGPGTMPGKNGDEQVPGYREEEGSRAQLRDRHLFRLPLRYRKLALVRRAFLCAGGQTDAQARYRGEDLLQESAERPLCTPVARDGTAQYPHPPNPAG